jgi:long-chain acyl-CoA synthetase
MSMAKFLVDAARQWPDQPAIFIDDSVDKTFSEWHQRCLEIATVLSSQHNIVAGDRVALFANNHAHYLHYFYAAWYIGAIIVPINARLHVREAGWILGDNKARVCICDSDRLDELQALVEGCSFIDINMSLAPLDGVVRDDLPLHRESSDVAWLFYTSGTTGKPKGVMMTHEMLRQMCLNYLADLDVFHADNRVVHWAPQSHGSGMLSILTLCRGGANVIPHQFKFSASGVEQTLCAHRHVCSFMAPTMVRKLLDLDIDDRLGNLETVVYGGGPMFLADIREAVSRLGDRFVQIYGQGEAPMTIARLTRSQIVNAYQSGDDPLLASVGQAFTGVEVDIFDNDGRPAPLGEVGEIVVRGPVVMAGYWGRPEATAETVKNGWLYTGDMGVMDNRGLLTMKDRSKDMVVSGGLNIYPREIEEVLLEHPAVAEVAVVGKMDPKWGESLLACVVLKASARAESAELESWCRDHLAGFKCPKLWEFLDELPKNNYGKILKRELRAQFA